MMTACWRYGVLFCNSFMVFGVYYFMPIPIALQNEMANSYNSYIGSNNTGDQTNCKVCLGLGEVRYNLLFSVTRWASVAVCLPSGVMIDRLGNGRSAILFSTMLLIGSVLFAVGATSSPPVTTPMYILMATGYGFLAFGDASLRFAQARVVSYYFPEETLTALAFSLLGHVGYGISFYITPVIATTIGLQPAIWLGIFTLRLIQKITGPVSCGFGVLSAVGLAFLLQLHPIVPAEDNENRPRLTLNVFWGLPASYWLLILTIGFTDVCWIVKDANLPDYLELRHGYTMSEASRINGIAGFICILCPLASVILNKIDCDGIMILFIQVLLMTFYVLLGFCPSVNIIALSVADGICISLNTIIAWQLIVVLCPVSYVGTLSSLVIMVRNSIIALTFIAAGYILQTDIVADKDEALSHYRNFFFMIITISAIEITFGFVLNIVDIRKGGALNSRVRKWQQSNIEAIGLISMEGPSNKYCDNNDATETEDYTMNGT